MGGDVSYFIISYNDELWAFEWLSSKENITPMQEIQSQFLGGEDNLENGNTL